MSNLIRSFPLITFLKDKNGGSIKSPKAGRPRRGCFEYISYLILNILNHALKFMFLRGLITFYR